MFRDNTFSANSIDDLLRHYQGRSGGNDHASTVRLLQATKDFLNYTDSSFQERRESFMKEADILCRLNSVASGLRSFKAKDGNTDDNETLAKCVQTITDRLDTMRFHNDKIATYYDSHDNDLKAYMTGSHEHTRRL
tara:strand:- start:418 stop:825 length:408 start_codon:yes stop_codon:yes gene_type:complete